MAGLAVRPVPRRWAFVASVIIGGTLFGAMCWLLALSICLRRRSAAFSCDAPDEMEEKLSELDVLPLLSCDSVRSTPIERFVATCWRVISGDC